MPRKSVLGTLLIFTLLSLLLLPSGGVALADPPPPMERQMIALEPAAGVSDPGAVSDISAMATTVLYPSHDAPVRAGAPNATAPNQLYLGVGYDNGWLYGSTGLVRSYLRFDLSSLPVDSTITSATLRVYQAAGQDYPDVRRTITFYRVTGSWNESSVTWNNRPGYAEAVGSVRTTYDFQDWLEVDLTDLVQAWVEGSQANYGLVAIGPESIEGILRAFGSSESAYSPELLVSYIPTPPPVLDVSPGTAYVRTDSSKQLSIQISNVTANSLNWTATKLGGAAWLILDKTSGNATPTSPDTLGLSVNPGTRPPGTYTEQIRISSSTPEVEGSPQTITITMEVVDSLDQVYLPFILRGTGGSSAPQIVALAIGIADYQYLAPPSGSDDLPDDPSSGDLWAPKFDLEDMVNFLQNVLGVPAGNIIQLGENAATKSNVVLAFNELDGKESKDTIVIIYYSGHGGQVPDSNGDESDDRDEFIAMYGVRAVPGGYEGILTDDELEALLEKLESVYIIVILDSCYSGEMMYTEAIQGSGDLLGRGLGYTGGESEYSVQEDMMAMAELVGPGRVIITGGTGDQVTWESYSLENGVFTYFFLQGLQDAVNDANQNNRISAEEAYWFSRDWVDDWVNTSQGVHQNPDISDEHPGQVDLAWLP
jgi:hypothetical protein